MFSSEVPSDLGDDTRLWSGSDQFAHDTTDIQLRLAHASLYSTQQADARPILPSVCHSASDQSVCFRDP